MCTESFGSRQAPDTFFTMSHPDRAAGVTMVARHDEYYFEDGNVVFQVSGSTMTRPCRVC